MGPGDFCMTDVREGHRVRCVDDRARVGTVEALHKTSADVLFDGDDDTSRVKLERIEPKIGRTAGTVQTPHKDIKDIAFENVTSLVVKERMAKLHLSWNQLAERSGLSRATIARVVRGEDDRVPSTTLEALAQAIGVTPSVFWRKVTD